MWSGLGLHRTSGFAPPESQDSDPTSPTHPKKKVFERDGSIGHLAFIKKMLCMHTLIWEVCWYWGNGMSWMTRNMDGTEFQALDSWCERAVSCMCRSRAVNLCPFLELVGLAPYVYSRGHFVAIILSNVWWTLKTCWHMLCLVVVASSVPKSAYRFKLYRNIPEYVFYGVIWRQGRHKVTKWFGPDESWLNPFGQSTMISFAFPWALYRFV